MEYADVKVLVDVGLRNNNNNNNIHDNSNIHNNTLGDDGARSQQSPHSFWESLPPHDCLVLTDSTLESLGSLPLYVEGMRRAFRKRRNGEESSNSNTNAIANSTSSQQQQHRRGSFRKDNNKDLFGDSNESFVLPIFATFPTVKMGQMTLYDHHANLSLDGGSPPYTLEEMDGAISMLRTIKYAQTLTLPLPLPPPVDSNNAGAGASAANNSKIEPRLQITAHRAGHVVGGAFYKLHRLRDDTSVVVTGNSYHIAKELHLDGCTLEKNGTGADVLVTRPGGPAFPLVNGLYSSSNNKNKNRNRNKNNKNHKKSKAMMVSPLASRARQDLTERVLGFLRRDANVLLPVDASGRVLELILLFNRFWSKQNLSGSYNLVWFGSMVHNTLEFCRSQTEWMNSALGKNIFDTNRGKGKSGDHGQHPYLLKNVILCTNMAQLDKILAESNDNPTCVLANGLTLDNGPARDLFLRWADNDNNAVIFTDSSQCLEREKAIVPRASETSDAASGNASSEATTANSNISSLEAGARIGAQASAPTSQGVASVAAVVATADDNAEGGVDHTIEDDMMGTAITEDEASPHTATYQLLRHWSLAKAEDREMDDVLNVDVLIPRRKPLVGNELSVFLEREEAARVAQRKLEDEQAMLREVELAKGRLRLGEDTGTNLSAVGGGTSSAVGNSLGTASQGGGTTSRPSTAAHLPFFRVKKKSRFDSSLFLKFSKPLHLTFELREPVVGVGQNEVTARFGIGESMNSEVLEDDYGIAVLPDQFRDIVTGVDPSKFGAQKDEINKRGLGYASSSGAGGTGGGKDDSSKGAKKRSRKDDLGLGGNDDADGGNAEDEDDSGERGMEAIDLSEGKGIIRGRNGRPPSKVSTIHRRIEVVAEIDYIPFEGRVDSRSARQSVRALKPRHVVVLGGTRPESDGNGVDKDVMEVDKDTTGEGSDSPEEPSPESLLLVDEVRALADAAEGFLVSQKDPVLTPSDFQTMELKVGYHAYPTRLVSTPFRTREERMTEDFVPDPIELVETKIGSCTVSMLDFVMTGQKVALDGSVVIAPKNTNNNNAASTCKEISVFEQERSRPPVYVSDGEVLLTDLRTELIAKHGMKAEYSAHSGFSQLIVNGRIVVKKWSVSGSNNNNTPGKIDVEGPLCEDFFTVRSVVCNQYVVL